MELPADSVSFAMMSCLFRVGYVSVHNTSDLICFFGVFNVFKHFVFHSKFFFRMVRLPLLCCICLHFSGITIIEDFAILCFLHL